MIAAMVIYLFFPSCAVAMKQAGDRLAGFQMPNMHSLSLLIA